MFFWFAVFLNAVLFAGLLALIVMMFRVIFDKEFAKNPPFVPTFGKESMIITTEVAKILESSSMQMKIVDPGCGIGSLIIEMAKKYPDHKFVGVEWSFFVYCLCKLRCKRFANIEIIKANLFDYSFVDADVIVCFLMPPLMERLGEKIIKECKRNVVVFSNSFIIPNMTLEKEYKTKKKGFIENVYKYNLGF